jgi:hypothetical protein
VGSGDGGPSLPGVPAGPDITTDFGPPGDPPITDEGPSTGGPPNGDPPPKGPNDGPPNDGPPHGDETTHDIAAPAPEPATWLTLILGFGILGQSLRVRRRTLA